jgi:ParE toxin of type II toxin-antitoxin system, parDE
MAKAPIRVLFDIRASREIDDARAWWAENRCTTDLDDALAEALDRIEQFPEIAPRVKSGGRWTMTRRYILGRRVGYHLYYDYNPRGLRIYVRSLWHERRPKPRL